MGKLNLLKAKKNEKSGAVCGNIEFTTEFADEILYDNYTKGVSFLTLGDKVKLTYNGLLARSGAQDLYAVVGFGDNNNWKETRTYPMNSTNQQIFELSIPVEEGAQVNVAFKDNANNWDNNSGRNYSFYVH
ncbi:MAG: carbohydrate-binding protein [Clostridia bacterium]|nr:carbohydrate-binding protein [Clostridia bacterium]